MWFHRQTYSRNKLATSPSTGKLYGETCLQILGNTQRLSGAYVATFASSWSIVHSSAYLLRTIRNVLLSAQKHSGSATCWMRCYWQIAYGFSLDRLSKTYSLCRLCCMRIISLRTAMGVMHYTTPAVGVMTILAKQNAWAINLKICLFVCTFGKKSLNPKPCFVLLCYSYRLHTDFF